MVALVNQAINTTDAAMETRKSWPLQKQWTTIWMVCRATDWYFMFSWFIGLVGHLRSHFKPLFNLYIVLKDRETPPNEDEIAFASGRKEFTGQDQAEYLKALEARASMIASAFLRQEQAVLVSYAVHIVRYHDWHRFRGLSTLQSLSVFSLNGLLLVISHLMK